MTAKTGNQKKFPTFARMLISALSKTSNSVKFDIYNYEQLEAIRNHPGKKKSSNTSIINSQKLINNRYFILSYTVEFDQINYPLILAYEEISNVKDLKKIIT